MDDPLDKLFGRLLAANHGASNIALLIIAISILLPLLDPASPTLSTAFSLFLCYEGARDMGTVTSILLYAMASSFLPYLNALFLLSSHTPSSGDTLYLSFHAMYCALFLAGVCTTVWQATISPLYAAGAMVLALCILMKAHSFTLTNLAMAREKVSRGTSWPSNLTLQNYCLFLILPTLTYESSYKRSPSIRISYLCIKLGVLLLTNFFSLYILLSHIVPIIAKRTPPSSFPHLPPVLAAAAAAAVDLLRLSIPSILLWLSAFVAFFSCGLGILGELTFFSDRRFFDVFWEARSLGVFWSKWNYVVHVWAKRHILLEAQAYLLMGKRGAIILTFFTSAILHELVLTVSFKRVRPYFFLAMLMQLPLIALSRMVGGTKNSRWGNLFVWMSLWVGQASLEMIYLR